MNRLIALATLLSGSLTFASLASDCPGAEPRNPDPRPNPYAGAAGAPQGGAGGAAGASIAGQGGAPQAGAGGAGGEVDPPYCSLPPVTAPDPALADLKGKLSTTLAGLGYGPASAWLAYRETFGAQTTIALVPPQGPAWPATKVEKVRTAMGAGYVALPAPACATCGLRNPCLPSGEPRLLGIAVDVGAMPVQGAGQDEG